MKPTPEYLAECFHLAADGTLIWKVRPRSHFSSESRWKAVNKAKAGKVAGNPHRNGNVRVGIDGQSFYAQVLVWLLTTGQWPQGKIIHVNGDKGCNAPGNLREVSYGDAAATGGLRKSQGVVKVAPSGRYVARVSGSHAGTFDTLEEAAAVQQEARKRRLESIYGSPLHNETPMCSVSTS